MQFVMPPALDRILRETPELSRAYLAGGSVRDALLNCPPKDFDVEVYGVTYEQLVAALRRLNAEGLAILLVEQDVVTALELCGSAYVMDMGRIVRSGRSDELIKDPAIRHAYLGEIVD